MFPTHKASQSGQGHAQLLFLESLLLAYLFELQNLLKLQLSQYCTGSSQWHHFLPSNFPSSWQRFWHYQLRRCRSCSQTETQSSEWPHVQHLLGTPLYESEDGRAQVDKAVHQKVTNLGMKRSAEDLYNRLAPIAEALNKVQSDKCMIGDAVTIWRDVEEAFIRAGDKTAQKKWKERYNQAMTPAHFLAHLLNLKRSCRGVLSTIKVRSIWIFYIINFSDKYLLADLLF